MKELQREHREWIDKKYPNQRSKIPAVGCLEEAGELIHALLKLELVQTWGEDERHKLTRLRLKLVDAIGDCGIYACSLCNANEWDFLENWNYANVIITADALDMTIVLVQAATELALQPWSYGALHKYLSQLKSVAQLLGLDAEAVIMATWQTVKER